MADNKDNIPSFKPNPNIKKLKAGLTFTGYMEYWQLFFLQYNFSTGMDLPKKPI